MDHVLGNLGLEDDLLVSGIAARLAAAGKRMTVRDVAAMAGRPVGHASAASMLRDWGRRTLAKIAGFGLAEAPVESRAERRVALAYGADGGALVFVGDVMLSVSAEELARSLAEENLVWVGGDRGGGFGIVVRPAAVAVRLEVSEFAFLSGEASARRATEATV
jgi:hypothetical protein